MKYILCIVALWATYSFSTAQCSLNNISIRNIQCYNSNNFTALLDFTTDKGEEEFFSVYYEERLLGNYRYGSLPVEISIGEDCGGSIPIHIVDLKDPSCNQRYEINDVCCSSPCAPIIKDIRSTTCNSRTIDGSFVVETNKAYGDSLLIRDAKGNESYYLSNTTITIKDIEVSDDVTIPFQVCTFASDTCCTTVEFRNTCNCDMYDPKIFAISCNPVDSTYGVSIDFKSNMVSDSFIIGGDSKNYGKYAYTDLPIEITGIKFESEYDKSFLVLDNRSSFCFSDIPMDTISSCADLCALRNVSYTITECKQDSFGLDITFDRVFSSSTTFEVLIDGTSVGTFDYKNSGISVTSIPSYCNAYHRVEIKDPNNSGCGTSFRLDRKVCCKDDFALEVLPTDCSAEMVSLRIKGPEGVSDNIEITVANTLTAKTVKKTAPINSTVTFSEKEIGNGLFVFTANYGGKSYRESLYYNCGCNISDVEIALTSCDDNGMVNATLTFAHRGTSDRFSVVGNGRNYGFFNFGESSYDLGKLKADCTTLYEFEIKDQSKTSCSAVKELTEAICCSTSIDEQNEPRPAVRYAEGQLYITDIVTSYQLSIFTTDGRQVHKSTLHPWKETTVPFHAEAGVYLVNIQNKDNIFTHKIIVH